MTAIARNTKIRHVFGNVMRLAIPLTKKTRTLVEGRIVEIEEPFYPNHDFPTKVTLYKGGGLRKEYTAVVAGNIAEITDDGTLPIGTYQVEVICHGESGMPMRYMVRSVVDIVDATVEAGIEPGVEFYGTTYSLEGAVFFFAKGDKGEKGDPGAVFTPNVDDQGNLSWTNDGGLPNPETVNIKGQQGTGVQSVEQIVTSEESGGINVVRMTLTDGSTTDFEIRNGEKVEPQYQEGVHEDGTINF